MIQASQVRASAESVRDILLDFLEMMRLVTSELETVRSLKDRRDIAIRRAIACLTIADGELADRALEAVGVLTESLHD